MRVGGWPSHAKMAPPQLSGTASSLNPLMFGSLATGTFVVVVVGHAANDARVLSRAETATNRARARDDAKERGMGTPTVRCGPPWAPKACAPPWLAHASRRGGRAWGGVAAERQVSARRLGRVNGN